MEVIGETDSKCLIILKTVKANNGIIQSEDEDKSFELLLFNPHENKVKDKEQDPLKLILKCTLPPQKSIIQASLQILTQTALTSQSLLTLVYREATAHETAQEEIIYQFSSTLFLLENLNQNFDSSPSSCSEDDSPNNSMSTSITNIKTPKFASIVILEEIDLVKEQENELRVHLLPTVRANLDYEDVASHQNGRRDDLTSSQLSINQIVSYKNQIIALSLQECE